MSYPDITEAILLEGAPVESFDRTAAALNVVGASTSASRSLLDTNTANYIYVNTSTGNDTTGTGAVGAPYKTLTKAYSVWSSGKVVHVVNSDAITLGSGAETTTSIDRATQAAVGIAPVVSLSTQWTVTGRTHDASLSGTVYSAANNGTTYVVGDSAGNLNRSTDGITWSAVTEAAGFGANTVAVLMWGAGLFVAAGANGKIMTSPDGTTWTDRTAATGWGTETCAGGAYGHAGFIIVGADTGKIQTSTDGITWSPQTTPAGLLSESLIGVAYGNGRYVVVSATTGSKKIVYSDDLANFNVYTRTTANPGSASAYQRIAFGNGVFVIASSTTLYEYSYDGLAWLTAEQPASNSFTTIYGVAYGGGYFVAFGLRSGQRYIHTSPDGIVWTDRTAAAASNAFYCAVFGNNGWVFAGATVSSVKIETSPGAIKLKGSICGFDFASVGLYVASTNAAVTVINCDADYGIDAVKDSNGFTTKNSVVRNIRSIENIPAELSENVVTGKVELFKTYASTNKVNRNTFIGGYSDWDTTTTDIDQFRDNIIEGGISTNRVLTVESGNVRGGYSASVTLTSGAVSSVAPLFIGTGSTPYALRRVADGFPSDSPLLEASTLYDPDGTSGSGRDLGAYSFDATAVSETWTVAFWLPRPTQATFATVPKAYYSPTRSGAINGINRPEGWAEQIAVQWTNLTQEQYANLLLLADETSTRVRLTWNPSLSSLTSVTANGGASQGDIVLTVDASAIPVGAIVTIGGEEHRVIKRYPETGNATQLIFNQKLAAAVSDNEVLTVTGSTGYGEYLIKWPDTLGAVPWVSTDQDNYSGLGLAFVRARP